MLTFLLVAVFIGDQAVGGVSLHHQSNEKKEIDLLCHGSQSQCDLQKFLELGDMQYISGKNNRLRITLRMSAGAMKFRS